MTPEELRLECLKLAQHSANASGLLIEPNKIISRAQTYADFVMDRRGQDAAGSVNGEQNGEIDITSEGFPKHRPVAAPMQSRALDGTA
jgi:hypothetical protein